MSQDQDIIELEQAVIGAILLESTAYPMVASILNPKCFLVKKNALIYDACTTLFDR